MIRIFDSLSGIVSSWPLPTRPRRRLRRAGSIKGDRVATTDDDSKLVLGVALYGYNWPIATVGTCPPDQEGKTSVSQRSIDELLAKRTATPVHDPVTGESSFTYQLQATDGTNTCTQTREVHYIDAEGSRERIDLARTERLGAVSLWALGFDSPATWQNIGQLARVPSTAPATSVAP